MKFYGPQDFAATAEKDDAYWLERVSQETAEQLLRWLSEPGDKVYLRIVGREKHIKKVVQGLREVGWEVAVPFTVPSGNNVLVKWPNGKIPYHEKAHDWDFEGFGFLDHKGALDHNQTFTPEEHFEAVKAYDPSTSILEKIKSDAVRLIQKPGDTMFMCDPGSMNKDGLIKAIDVLRSKGWDVAVSDSGKKYDPKFVCVQAPGGRRPEPKDQYSPGYDWEGFGYLAQEDNDNG